MSNLLSIISRTLVLCSCFVLVVGCQPGATTDTAQTDGHGHDHGDGHAHAHPDNYGELVHEIEHLAESVLGAFSEGNGELAHDDLHEVGHLLEDVVKLAEKAGMEGEELAEVTAAAESAFVAFGALDTFHDENPEEVDIAQVTTDARAAIAILHAHEPEGSGHHDHDGHDHGHGHDGHDHDDHEGHDHDHDEDK